MAFAGMAGLANAAPALADTIASTPSGIGYCRSGGCWSLYSVQTLAAHFSVSETTHITSVLGWLAPGYDDTVTISLLQSSGAPGPNALPGQALQSASFAFARLPGDSDYYYSRWAGVSGLDWTIAAGDYWISFAAGNTTGSGVDTMGPFAGPSANGFAYYNSGNGYWLRNDALNLGFRVLGDVPSAAPEAASWAMMIVGFGAIGAAARRRRGMAARPA